MYQSNGLYAECRLESPPHANQWSLNAGRGLKRVGHSQAAPDAAAPRHRAAVVRVARVKGVHATARSDSAARILDCPRTAFLLFVPAPPPLPNTAHRKQRSGSSTTRRVQTQHS